MLQDMQIYSLFTLSSNVGVSAVYTNNGQHETGLRNIVIYPGACRREITYETGFGGATYITLDNVEIRRPLYCYLWCRKCVGRYQLWQHTGEH